MNAKRMISLLALVALMASSCTKEVVRTQTGRLGTKTVSAEAGSFLVLVSTRGVWSVSSPDAWIGVDGRYYKDESAFEVRYASNESTTADHRFCRVGRVVVKTFDGARADTLTLRQEGLSPFIGLEPNYTVDAAAGTYSLPLQTNLTDRERAGITCRAADSWARDLRWGADGRSLTLSVGAGSGRSTTIKLTFRDAWGREYPATATLRQE